MCECGSEWYVWPAMEWRPVQDVFSTCVYLSVLDVTPLGKMMDI